jgi:peroxiredoxin
MWLTFVYGQNKQLMIGQKAPDFNLKDLNQNTLKLSDLKGNFVVLHFAASW